MNSKQIETIRQAAFIMQNEGRNDIAEKLRLQIDVADERGRRDRLAERLEATCINTPAGGQDLWQAIADEALQEQREHALKQDIETTEEEPNKYTTVIDRDGWNWMRGTADPDRPWICVSDKPESVGASGGRKTWDELVRTRGPIMSN